MLALLLCRWHRRLRFASPLLTRVRGWMLVLMPLLGSLFWLWLLLLLLPLVLLLFVLLLLLLLLLLSRLLLVVVVVRLLRMRLLRLQRWWGAIRCRRWQQPPAPCQRCVANCTGDL